MASPCRDVLASVVGLFGVAALISGILWAASAAPKPSAALLPAPSYERFAEPREAPVVAYAENPLNHYMWATIRSLGRWDIRPVTDTRQLAETALRGDALPAAMVGGADSVVAIVDPRDLEQLSADSGNRLRVIGTAPPGYFVILSDLVSAQSRDPDRSCTFEWRGKTIGYLQRTDRLFIQALLAGYRIPEDAVRLRKIPMDQWDKLSGLLENDDVYRIVTYVVPGSPFLGLLKRQRVYPQGFEYINPEWVQAFHPYLSLEEAPLGDLFNDRVITTQAFVFPKDAYGPLFKMVQPIVLLEGAVPEPLAPLPPTTEAFTVSRLDNPADAYDPGYRCFGDTMTENKAQCESPYDVIGRPKGFTSVWDKPCFRDSDCPFWNDVTAEIGRGGCQSGGVCEMASGVRRTGFRTYEGTPFCYGCTDATAKDCCSSQDQPDYVFAGDTAARQALGTNKDILLADPAMARDDFIGAV